MVTTRPQDAGEERRPAGVVLIHEFVDAGPRMRSCPRWRAGDGLTAFTDGVTCPHCRDRRSDPAVCSSRSVRYGRRCAGKRGHGGLHHAEAHGTMYVWTDDASPELALDLLAAR